MVQWWRYLIILSIPTHGDWLQTNPLEHESDDRADHTVSSVCIANGKDMALQRLIWSTFVTVLWFRKTKIPDRAWRLVLVRNCELWIPKFTDNFGTVSSNMYKKAVTIFIPLKKMWRKMVPSVCLKPVSLATWRLHTLCRFTVPACYQVRCLNCFSL